MIDLIRTKKELEECRLCSCEGPVNEDCYSCRLHATILDLWRERRGLKADIRSLQRGDDWGPGAGTMGIGSGQA